MRVKFLMELERGHPAPAKDENPNARNQLVAMQKSWINTNKNRVGNCGGGKASRAEDSGLSGPSGRATTPPLTT